MFYCMSHCLSFFLLLFLFILFVYVLLCLLTNYSSDQCCPKTFKTYMQLLVGSALTVTETSGFQPNYILLVEHAIAHADLHLIILSSFSLIWEKQHCPWQLR